jgi:thiol-disulfide isomerase/thioredoxin
MNMTTSPPPDPAAPPAPAPSGKTLGAVFRFAGRLGQMLTTPRAALERVDREGGGLRDAIWLVVLGAVTFRFAQLLEAVLGLGAPTIDAVIGIARVGATEIQDAAWVVLPAAVIITLLAGARRDSSRDLELGAACYTPYFLVRAVERAIDALDGARTLSPLEAQIPAGVIAALVVVRAVLVARARGAFPAPVVVQPRPAARAAGFGLGVIALVGLAGNAVWSVRHLPALMPVSRGQAAPDFTLPRADGTPGTIALAAQRGHVVVLDFWATWCPPCLAMLPTMHDLYAEWGPRGVSFVGVNSDGGIDPQKLRDFVIERSVPYPIVIDEGDVQGLYKVRALPELVVIGKDGAIRRTFVGFTSKSSIADVLAEAVAAKP